MSAMNWAFYFVILIGVVALMRMRRSGQIASKEAEEFVRNGALIVDVRSPQEYSAGHLSQAFNMPVDQIEMLLPNKVKDKDRVILVHCQSGLRSKKAKDRLTRIGYNHVFNLGSYERAFKIVSGRHL